MGKLWIWISNELIEIEIEIKIKDEYAKLIPELSEGEYNELKQSIKENGLWSPIIINKKGYILDGQHRYRISRGLGISPSTTLKIFDDQLQEKLFVIDSNLTRRQLSEFARIEIALTKKRILEQMAKLNMSPGGKGVRIQTPLGRIAVTKIAIVPRCMFLKHRP